MQVLFPIFHNIFPTVVIQVKRTLILSEAPQVFTIIQLSSLFYQKYDILDDRKKTALHRNKRNNRTINKCETAAEY